ncbi:hypothetical protein X772_31325 [Mesorhizobium sp. LSJC280B00]|nr:hypothetical protein X772_31325 [Mesorhizobium sp. LSJC280B00]
MGREIFSLDGKRVWVAGHRGMVGQALTQCLRQEGCHLVSTGTQRVDLRRQQDSDDLPINVGTGEDITIADFAEAVAQTVGFKGRICFDSSKPDGAPRKLVDVGRMAALGWRARTGLRQGLKRFYEAHLAAEGGSGARSAPVGVEIATTAE